MRTCCFLTICLLKVGYLIAGVSQTPSVVLQEGQNTSLKCTQTEEHERMFWYRQDAGLHLQFLYHFYFENLIEKGIVSNRFVAKRPQTKHFNLNIFLAERQDSAVYFCASSLNTALQSNPLFLQKLLHFRCTVAKPKAMEDTGKKLDRFIPEKTQKETCNLKINPVEPGDSAVYFCASSLDTALQIPRSGEGLLFQMPVWMSRKIGEKVALGCYQNDTDYGWIYWYQQKAAGRQMEFIGWNGFFTLISREGNHALPCGGPKGGLFHELAGCANTGQLYFAGGTRLTVLEKGQKTSSPNVTIFAPSEEEVNEKQKATIVCLATNFFPDHVNLTWYLNDELRTDGVKTEAPEYDKTKKEYSLVSRIRITSKEWRNSNNKFKCNVEFYNEIGKSDYSDEISGRECDGGSAEAKETYLRRANLGKLVYIILIFKSTLYGAFVMGLKLRKKVVP
ncbi:M1-specific T cell receptor beta chain-like [Anolis sagrei]|uniref:M1-specific T cell receptor beta chain-like n=1 Tax=Anolis sagrei TaxID=38937 RepID=UPI003522D88B